jgi:hypothetical protein
MSVILSREQDASAEFLRASEKLKEAATDGHGQGLATFAGHLVNALNEFGLSELNARQAERLQALKLRAETARASKSLSDGHNEKGLRSLESARGGLKLFQEELAGYPKAPNIGPAVKAFQQDLREQLTHLEIKAEDVTRLDAALREGFQVASKGAAGLPGYLKKHLDELEKVRRGANRGAVENIPIWKVIAIVVAIGVWVWALFKCGIFGSCTLAEGLAYATIFWISVLIVKFC